MNQGAEFSEASTCIQHKRNSYLKSTRETPISKIAHS